MDNGQCKKSHFQEKVNTHKGLSGESGGQSSQKFGATQRGKVWYINLEFLKEVSAPENSRSGIQSLLKPSLTSIVKMSLNISGMLVAYCGGFDTDNREKS